MKGFLERDLTEAAVEFANCCKLLTNWLRVFDHFVRLALKGLRRGFLKKTHQIYRSKFDAFQFYWNHTSARCSPVNLLHIFRTFCTRTPLEGCFWFRICKLLIHLAFYVPVIQVKETSQLLTAYRKNFLSFSKFLK